MPGHHKPRHGEIMYSMGAELHDLVRPLGRRNLYDLPFWIKQFPHIGQTISPCGGPTPEIYLLLIGGCTSETRTP